MFRSCHRTDLDDPAKDDNDHRLCFLSAPNTLSRSYAFGLGHGLMLPNIRIDKRLLRGRVCITTAVMWGIKPPMDGEVHGPDGIEDMIGEEYMRKVKHVFRILLCNAKNGFGWKKRKG